MGETPILSQLLRKGFLETEKLKEILSVSVEDVIGSWRGCLEEISSG